MKSSRAVIVLFLALLCGLGAMFLGARFVTGGSNATTKVVVTAQQVPVGTPITESMIQTIDWPGSALPVGAFTKMEDLIGRVPASTLQKGEPVLDGRLTAAGTKGGLSAVIPDGFRAITVRVNEVMGVAGFALPGTFVDLMVNVRGTGDEGPVSKIVLERIQVLAVAQDASEDVTKAKVVNAVTLKVTPEQAETIDLARNVGTLSLVLRSQGDQQASNTEGVRTEDLIASKVPKLVPIVRPKVEPAPVKQKPVAKPQPKTEVIVAAPTSAATPVRARVEVIRGVQRSESEL